MFEEKQLIGLVDEVVRQSKEMTTVEIKSNATEPHVIGEYISALANAAALAEKPHGIMIWGIEDVTFTVKGTTFRFDGKGKGNEDLIPWLNRLLSPQVHFEFSDLIYDSKRLVVLTVEAASHQPVKFNSRAWVRVDSHKKSLDSQPDYERRLWKALDSQSFESGIALDRVTEERVLALLAHEEYFALLDRPSPASRERILEVLIDDGLVIRSITGEFQITNLGAVLFARDLENFATVKRKSLRMTRYSGNDKSAPARSAEISRGYAVGYRDLIAFLLSQIEATEHFANGVRTEEPVIPERVLRELVANALIHQDFSVKGAGPTVDIFDDRVEVTNPGAPLVDKERLIDAAPRSRNEALASLMRRLGFCEERGSGWDLIAAQVELNDLPAPLVELSEGFMRVVVFVHRPFNELSRDERIWAVYMHACLLQVSHRHATNASLRERFRVADKNKAAISRLIADSITAGVIVPFDEAVGAKAKSYVPFWAK